MTHVTWSTLEGCLRQLNVRYMTGHTMMLTLGDRGWASTNKGRFTIPRHALEKGTGYAFYYVCHEFAHMLVPNHGHDETFKEKEAEVCGLFGISVEHKKAYPQALRIGGQVVYGQAAHPNESNEAKTRRMCRNESSRRSKAKRRGY